MIDATDSRTPDNQAATNELKNLENKLRDKGHNTLADKIGTLYTAISAITEEEEILIEGLNLE